MQTYTGNIYEDRNIYGKKFFCHIYSYKILTKIIQYDEYCVLKNYTGSNKSERCQSIAFLKEDQHAQRCAYFYESFNCFFAKDEHCDSSHLQPRSLTILCLPLRNKVRRDEVKREETSLVDAAHPGAMTKSFYIRVLTMSLNKAATVIE